MVILINGCINSGKSTVSSALKKRLPRSAHIELDDICHFMDLPLKEAIPITIEAAVAVAKVFLSRGLHVIMSYPLGQSNYEYIESQLRPIDPKIMAFTLNTDLDVLLTNRGDRPLTDHERQRIREQYADGRHSPSFGTAINNTDWTPEQTAEHILSLVW